MKLRMPILILLCMSLVLCACREGSATRQEDTSDTSSEVTAAIPDQALLLFDGASFRLSVIVSEFASATVRSAASAVMRALTALGSESASVKFTEDYTNDEAVIRDAKDEVLVGLTNRPVSVAAQKKTLRSGSYSVEVNEDRVILAGISDSDIEAAAVYFCETFLPAHIFRNGKSVYLLPGRYEAPAADTSFIGYAVAYNRAGETFRYQTKQILDIAGISDTDFNIQQGACFDEQGRYGYFVLRDKKDNCALVKYDLQTGTLAVSNLDIGCDHGNDACYNPDNRTVVISHCTVNPSMLSVFDADTLELVRRVDIGYNNSAITYCRSRGQYVIMGEGYFRYLDADFNLVEEHATRQTPYTSQGIHCDDRYIYRVESSSAKVKGNVIEVYDWDGNYLMRMNLPDISLETETLAHFGETLYVICYMGKQKGGRVYRLTPDFG